MKNKTVWIVVAAAVLIAATGGIAAYTFTEFSEKRIAEAYAELMDAICEGAPEDMDSFRLHGVTACTVRKTYGGCYREGNTLRLCLTGEDPGLTDLLKKYPCIRVRIVERSFASLIRTVEKTISEYDEFYERYAGTREGDVFDRIRAVCVDEKENCVHVRIRNITQEDREFFAWRFSGDPALDLEEASTEYEIPEWGTRLDHYRDAVRVHELFGGFEEAETGYYKDLAIVEVYASAAG